MWVTSKKRVLFQKDRIEEKPVNNSVQNVQVVEEEFILEPNTGDHALDPVFVPDWIKQTEMYKLLKKEGSIVEASHGPKGQDEQENEDEKEVKTKVEKGSGTGLQHPWKK